MTQSEHPWMEHNVTGHRAQLPDDPYWRAQGWNPVDGPPPEPDLYHDPAPETPPDAGSSAAKPVKTAKAAAKTEEK